MIVLINFQVFRVSHRSGRERDVGPEEGQRIHRGVWPTHEGIGEEISREKHEALPRLPAGQVRDTVREQTAVQGRRLPHQVAGGVDEGHLQAHGQ